MRSSRQQESPSLVGGQDEKQVQPKVLGPQSWKEAFAAEAMVDPRERSRDGAHSLRHQQRQGFFQAAWHDLRYGKCATRRSRNATCLFGRECVSRLHIRREEIALCQKRRFQVSLELEKHAQSHAQRAGKNNLRRKFNQQKYKTTVMRACLGK